MIIFERVTKVAGGAGKREVLRAAQVSLPSDRRIAVFGPAEDKKLLMDLLGGLAMPTEGRIIRKARVSFPAGHLGGFTRELSARLNVAHVARLYGADVEAVVSFVEEASALGEDFKKPYAGLSPVQKRKLSEILAFSIPFDVYLVDDEVVRLKGKLFNKDARALFEARTKTSGIIVASEDAAFAREFCDMGLVLKNGRLRLFRNLERALLFAERAKTQALADERMARRLDRRKRRHQGSGE